MKTLNINNELQKSIVRVARHKEFYGHVVQQFEKRFVRNPHPIDTAAVGRNPGEKFIKLYLNEDYFESIFDNFLARAGKSEQNIKNAMNAARDVCSGAVEHEIIHVVMSHLTRKFADKLRGNIALDCVVNQCINVERRMPTWVMPQRYLLPEGKTAQWYYENLKDNQNYKDDVANDVFGKGGELSSTVSGHSMWDDILKDPIVQEFLKDIVRKAVDNTSVEGWGDVPGNIKNEIAIFLERKKPKVPWNKVFRDFCASSTDSLLSYTMSRISKRFGTRPGTRKQDILRIAIAVDTSGSISEKQLEVFFNEVRWIWRNGAEVVVIEADAEVQRIYKFKGRFDGNVHGRGGTCLAPALEYIEGKRFDAAVYFTDFQAPRLPRRYRVPVLWVLNNEPTNKSYYPCDWGRVIKIDTEI